LNPEPMPENTLLETGKVTDCKLLPEGSNYTFLATVVGDGGISSLAIYKPSAGERPLWDFPAGTLYRREYAAYLISRSLGWDFIPFTIVREGPHGIGSLQEFISTQTSSGYFGLQARHETELWKMAVFDLFANNADRKASHCLLDYTDKLWGIDHGLTFNVDSKLRTVVWDFCGEPIPRFLIDDLTMLLKELNSNSVLTFQIEELLSSEESKMLRYRLGSVLMDPVFPQLDPNCNIPWPWF